MSNKNIKNILWIGLVASFMCTQSHAGNFPFSNIQYSSMHNDGVEVSLEMPTIMKNGVSFFISKKTSPDKLCKYLKLEKVLKFKYSNKSEPTLSISKKGYFDYYNESNENYYESITCQKNNNNPIVTMKKGFRSKGIGDLLPSIVLNFAIYGEKEIKEKSGVDVSFTLDLIDLSRFNSALANTTIPMVNNFEEKYSIPLNMNPYDFNNLEFSEDSVALTICHEISHHHKNLELVKKKVSEAESLNESYSDWYAADYCMNYFRSTNGLKFIEETKIAEEVKIYCDNQNIPSKDYNLCLRFASAALNLTLAQQGVSKLYLGKKAITAQPVTLLKQAVQESSVSGYPKHQCRLDIIKAKMSCLLKNEVNCTKPACWVEDDED